MSEPSDTLASDWQDRLESYVYNWVARAEVPSAAVSVVGPETELHATGVGARNLDTNAPATPETLYGIGSVTKSFTAATVMHLVETGDLDLDASPIDYLDREVPWLERVSLHQLLAHRSGLPSLGVSEALIARQADIGEATVPLADRDDFYRYLADAGAERTEPGQFRYSNTGYMLLADVVAAVTERPFSGVVSGTIFEPLQLSRTTMDEERFHADANAMTPYRDDGDGEWTPTPVPVRELSQGPGGIFTSVRELGRYLQMYLREGRAPDGTQILTPDSIDRMVEGHTDTPAGPYGYGWRTRSLDGQPIYGHSGSIAVSTAYAGWSPALDLGIAVAVNAAPGYRLAHLGEALLAAMLGHDPERMIGHFVKETRQHALVGTYSSYRDARRATVEPVGEALQFKLTEPIAGDPVTLVFEEATEAGYRYWAPTSEDGRRPVEFVETEDGYDVFYDRWRLHQE